MNSDRKLGKKRVVISVPRKDPGYNKRRDPNDNSNSSEINSKHRQEKTEENVN